MRKREVQFNREEFVNSVQELSDHVSGKRKLTLRTTRVPVAGSAPEVSPDEIEATRKALNLSQPLFAKLLNVPTITAISWEKGRRRPSGAALRLLQIVRRHPKIVQNL